MTGQRPLRVLYVPFGEHNPFQRLQVEHLRALGVAVRVGKAKGMLSLFRLLARGWVDVLHLHWIQPFVISRTSFLIAMVKAPLAMLQLAVMRLLGIRIVWTIHELHHHENPHPAWDALFNRLTARLAHHGITYCEAAARETRRFLGAIRLPLAVHPFPNYLPAYGPAPARADARRRLGLSDDAFVVLHLGLIRPYKGTLELIEAFGRLGEHGARLLVVGEVPDAAYAERLRHSAARIPGVTIEDRYVPDADIPAYVAAADVMALPFREVMNSSSVLLAMTYGLPVIAPRLGCVPEASGEDGGFLYDAADPGGLDRSLAAAIERRADLPAIGERNRREAAAHTWTADAQATLAVYRGA